MPPPPRPWIRRVHTADAALMWRVRPAPSRALHSTLHFLLLLQSPCSSLHSARRAAQAPSSTAPGLARRGAKTDSWSLAKTALRLSRLRAGTRAGCRRARPTGAGRPFSRPARAGAWIGSEGRVDLLCRLPWARAEKGCAGACRVRPRKSSPAAIEGVLRPYPLGRSLHRHDTLVYT